MRVIVITAAEPRNRQRFITQPLLASGHNVRVLKTKPFFFFLFNLRRFLTKDKPDVIIFMGAGVKELVAYSFMAFNRVPCVVRLGGDRIRDLDSVIASYWQYRLYIKWIKLKFDKFAAKRFLKKMHWAILVNQALCVRVENQLSKECKCFIVPQYCDGPAITRKYDITEPVKILTVTNLLFSEKSKGVIWLIDQLDLFVQKENIAVKYIVAGDGVHLDEVINYLQKKSLSEYFTVELVGFVSDLHSYYSSADVVLYRSYHDATPNVILESKRYGLPLLVNDSEEFRVLVEHDVTGLLYSDAAGFFISLKQILIRQDARERIGHAALHDYELNYSEKAVQENIERTLAAIIADSTNKGNS